jgi:hypothetical protein
VVRIDGATAVVDAVVGGGTAAENPEHPEPADR